MKFKRTTKSGRMLIEVGPRDVALPLPGTAPETVALPEFRLTRILVPVDFSTCAAKALKYAIPFAKQFNARLHLVYVERIHYAVPELGVVDMTKVDAQQVQEARVNLAALVKGEIRDQVAVSTQVRTGYPAQEIAAAARELDVDLIIISTHGRTGLKHVLMGSTAETVVRCAPCPVLVVREHEHEFIAPTMA